MTSMSGRQHVREQQKAARETARRAQSLLKVWLSPAFPTGAYAYSHGLEKAVENGWIKDRATLERWLRDLVEHGSVGNDLILVTCSWRATLSEAWPELCIIATLAQALQPTGERELEATQQGASFLQQIEVAWPYHGGNWAAVTGGCVATYPVAVGYAAARHSILLADVLDAFGLAFVSNLASAAIRLSIIGQTDAQHVTSALLSPVLAAAEKAASASLDDLGSATWLSDLASLQHETQHTRLFRS